MSVASSAAVRFAIAGRDTRLELRVRGQYRDGTACQFSIYKAADRSVIETIDGQVQRGKAVTTWSAVGPDEADAARSHRVFYEVTVDGTAQTTSPELEVYHDAIEVSSVGEDGAALPDVRFVLTITRAGARSRHTVQGSTGSTGSFRVTGLPPGDVELTWRSPARFLEWVEEPTGTKRKAKLKPAFRARLVWPPAGTHKQWVNHRARPDQPDLGSKLKVRVAVHPDDGPSRAGDEVFLKLEYPPQNQLSRRANPRRGVAGGAVQAWSRPMVGATKSVRADGGEVEFEVELGLAGGDKVTIHVGGTEACEDEQVEVTNWRRLYYHLMRPDNTRDHPTDQTDARLAPLFIEFERFRQTVLRPGENGAPPGTWQQGRMLGLTGDRADEWFLILGHHNHPWLEGLCDRTKGKLGLNTAICHLIFNGTPYQSSRAYAKTITAEVTAARTDVAIDARDDAKFVFPHGVTDGAHPFVRGRWQTVGGRARSGTLTRDMVVVDRVGRSVAVVLPAGTPTDPGSIVGDGTGGTQRIRVTITLRYALGNINGMAFPGGVQLLKNMPGVQSFNDVICHELGHAMGQAPNRDEPPPRPLAVREHGNTYDERGHVGPHCNHGLDAAGATHELVIRPDGTRDYVELAGRAASSRPNYTRLVKQVGTDYEGVDGTCIMWGASTTDDPSWATDGFCERCVPFVKAMTLDDVVG
ncbi:MAG: hypothetical protein KF878_11770 [Planctomycetes bacterium]|nr:hypothetical protein [Planctomycetota bacterium]